MIARLALFPLLVVLLAGCAKTPSTIKPIEFLTRGGCVLTDPMRVRFDEAIKASAQPITYEVVDIDTLPATDVRKGYPTPTVLVGGVDLFGMAQPAPPYPEPT